jgi:curved DNA-binding protein CbpA
VSGEIEGIRKFMAIPDYYAILEVNRSATAAEIKKSYRRLVRRYHPDLNGQSANAVTTASGTKTSEASRRIALLNEAYKILSNPQKRTAYDARRRSTEVRRTTDQSAPVPRHQPAQPTQPAPAPRKQEPKMTWIQGVFGFVRELKKAMREN